MRNQARATVPRDEGATRPAATPTTTGHWDDGTLIKQPSGRFVSSSGTRGLPFAYLGTANQQETSSACQESVHRSAAWRVRGSSSWPSEKPSARPRPRPAGRRPVRELAEFGHRGVLLPGAQLAPPGVALRCAREPSNENPASFRTVVDHVFKYDRQLGAWYWRHRERSAARAMSRADRFRGSRHSGAWGSAFTHARPPLRSTGLSPAASGCP
jgi:hypothetical protein